MQLLFPNPNGIEAYGWWHSSFFSQRSGLNSLGSEKNFSSRDVAQWQRVISVWKKYEWINVLPLLNQAYYSLCSMATELCAPNLTAKFYFYINLSASLLTFFGMVYSPIWISLSATTRALPGITGYNLQWQKRAQSYNGDFFIFFKLKTIQSVIPPARQYFSTFAFCMFQGNNQTEQLFKAPVGFMRRTSLCNGNQRWHLGLASAERKLCSGHKFSHS